MPFQLTQKSTLDDIERPYRTLLHKRCVFRSSPRKFKRRYRPTPSAAKM